MYFRAYLEQYRYTRFHTCLKKQPRIPAPSQHIARVSK
ncbi:Protein of unknown function [Pyronema omphalodes CBS 100304]|uniref:Uncharacterized protein n=1 Tax=Pyronema omphalodes (strain CBS 100304) TaxID=1076935 RepID=U4LEA6_PYROM|nr:Protein of unknown function [Pyronema omphalodes CBS 100304]